MKEPAVRSPQPAPRSDSQKYRRLASGVLERMDDDMALQSAVVPSTPPPNRQMPREPVRPALAQSSSGGRR